MKTSPYSLKAKNSLFFPTTPVLQTSHLHSAKLLTGLLLLLFTTTGYAQSQEVWSQFTVREKHGYKDASGHIRIPAKFGQFTRARKFRHIMAVHEGDSPADAYYLLKNGRKTGIDSVYMADFEFDCESESKIRFQNRKKDRVGFLNSRGQVIIPAVYNYATPFYNGMALALIGAHRKCWSGEKDTVHCEHLGWQGGRTVLINERNEILADNLADQVDGLNWYSLKRNDAHPDTATTVTFRTENGDRLSCTNYEKEFTQWLYGVFLPVVASGNAQKVALLCFPKVAVAARPFRGWPLIERAVFMEKYYQPVLRPKLEPLRPEAKNVAITSDELNTYIFTSSHFLPFLTDCGEPFQAKYPAFELIVTYLAQPGKKAVAEHQEHFEFIRTDSGYRLISVAL